MSEKILEKINKALHTMNEIAETDPEYYEACIQEHHEFLKEIKKELTEKQAPVAQ